MYLKEVQLENFKSFRKTKVTFLPGFTAVTGPNASGKSNITDAILFVLGPKSSKVVRAGKLTDLIFNGGNGKKLPGYCRVSLVFNNSDREIPLDDDIVTLTRLVKYANNPENYYSYFYVNGKISSLTEFENLLTGAHISADGYNFVQQGKINEITAMSNLERRRILDGIAGITKFDSDIEKAERKKEETEANLEKIKIVLHEIRAQIRSLEKDREGALKYKSIKDELILRKYQLSARKKINVEEEIGNIKKQVKDYSNQKNECEEKKQGLKKEFENAQRKLGEVEDKIADKGGEEAKEVKEKIDELRDNLVRATEGINYSRDEIKRLRDERAKIVIELGRVEKELKKMKKDGDAGEKDFGNKSKILDEKQEKYRNVQTLISKSDNESLSIQRDLSLLKKEYEEKQVELKTLTIDRDVISEKMERIKTDIASMEESVKTYEAEIKDATYEEKGLKNDLTEKDEADRKLKDELVLKKNEETKISEQVKEIEPKIAKLMNLRSQLKAEVDAKESVSKGYTRAVKSVLDARDRGELKGIHGAVAELGKVEEEYEDALSIAAGSRMQSVVVDTDENAAKAIMYLRRKKLGRVTFLPLNKMMKGMATGKSLMVVKEPDSLGFAIDLIKFDEKYRNAFWYVFGSTIIMKDLDCARKRMGGVRLATLKGELLEAGGAMIGGSTEKHMYFGKGESEIDKLSKELRENVRKQEELSSMLIGIREKINFITEEIRKNEVEVNTSKMRIGDLEVKHKDYLNRLNILKKDRAQKLNEKNENEKTLLNLNKKIEGNEKRLKELDKERGEKGKLLLKSTKIEFASASKSLQKEVENLTKEIRDLESKNTTLKTQIEIVGQRKQQLIENEKDIVNTIKTHEEKIENLTNARDEYKNRIDALMKVGQTMDETLKKLNETRDKLYRDVLNLKTNLEKYSDKINTYSDMSSSLSIKIPALEEKLAETIAEMQNYTPQDKDEELPSIEHLKEEMYRLEKQLDALGAVNMMAVENYDTINKRKNEVEEELKRLDNQKKNLIKLAENLQNKKREGLLKVFNAVNENFKGIYPQLSGDMEAELVLENSEDPLEGGLAIHIRPEERRMLKLDSLSGAQKSLTALALIFAIQRYEPSPFYILDEIDMFLDAVNAERVAQMVKNNSERAQFIVISLRKISLKEADHVYGVVKQKNDVSNIIGNVNISEVGEEGKINPGGRK